MTSPTAVLQVDLEKIPPALTGLERFGRAVVLGRLRGHPVAQAELCVENGRIDGAELRDALFRTGDWTLWQCWLHDYLGWDESAATDGPLPSMTVAVCTRDRPEDLGRCLEALDQLADGSHDVLVVDNCPTTDAAAEVATQHARVRYVREDRPGLNAARNRALREARHDVVAFTDDDARPDPGWLRALRRNFTDPLVLCATGLTMPAELETAAQQWFERRSAFGRGFQRRVYDATCHNPLVAGPVGAGVNMAVRLSVLDLLGGFDEALDAGTPTRSGGDHDMFTRILAAGYRIVYEPAALSWHRHRRTWDELRDTLYGYGVGVYAAWTRAFLIDGERSVPALAWGWFRHNQLPALVRSVLGRPGRAPLDLVLAELRGCAAGPWAYLASRRRARRPRVAT